MWSERMKNQKNQIQWDGTKIGLWYWTSIIAIYKLRIPHLRINITGRIISKIAPPLVCFCVNTTTNAYYAQVFAAIICDCNAAVRIQYTLQVVVSDSPFFSLIIIQLRHHLRSMDCVYHSQSAQYHNSLFLCQFIYLSHDIVWYGYWCTLLVQDFCLLLIHCILALKYPAFSFYYYYPSSRIYIIHDVAHVIYVMDLLTWLMLGSFFFFINIYCITFRLTKDSTHLTWLLRKLPVVGKVFGHRSPMLFVYYLVFHQIGKKKIFFFLFSQFSWMT